MDVRPPRPGPPCVRVPVPPPGPSPAATALAAVLTATGVVVRTPAATTTVSVSAVGPGGALLLLVPEDDVVVSCARAADIGELAAQVEASAVTPAPLPDRLLARVWLRGTLAEVRGSARRGAARALAARAGLGAAAGRVVDVAPGETVLRLAVAGGDLVDGPVHLALAETEWRTARLDPVADCSAGLVAHLLADHRAELAGLARAVTDVLPAPPAGGRAPVLVAVDRFGTRWRCASSGGALDARLDFPVPLEGVRDLHGALRGLVGAAGPNPTAGTGCGLHDCRTQEPRP